MICQTRVGFHVDFLLPASRLIFSLILFCRLHVKYMYIYFAGDPTGGECMQGGRGVRPLWRQLIPYTAVTFLLSVA